MNQIGHFNTENVTKLTKTKQAIPPMEEPEVCSKDMYFNFIIDFYREKKRWMLMKMVKFLICKSFNALRFLVLYVSCVRHQKSTAEFYTNFWILQDYFSKPFQLWERTSWNTFVHVCFYQ